MANERANVAQGVIIRGRHSATERSEGLGDVGDAGRLYNVASHKIGSIHMRWIGDAWG